jgi:hypothetical protein
MEFSALFEQAIGYHPFSSRGFCGVHLSQAEL